MLLEERGLLLSTGRGARSDRSSRWRRLIATTQTRVNEQIRISPVRLIDADGEQVGIVAIDEARQKASDSSLDLVEVAPTARPPVCRIMDWGKYQYEKQKAQKEAKSRQHTVDVKELKFRPKIEEHDFETKVGHGRRFLKKGNKVKVTVRYRGRELRRAELGRRVLDEVAEALSDISEVEGRSDRVEGRQISMMLGPKAN
jgi:translation initiation factor IF-3